MGKWLMKINQQKCFHILYICSFGDKIPLLSEMTIYWASTNHLVNLFGIIAKKKFSSIFWKTSNKRFYIIVRKQFLINYLIFYLKLIWSLNYFLSGIVLYIRSGNKREISQIWLELASPYAIWKLSSSQTQSTTDTFYRRFTLPEITRKTQTDRRNMTL